MMQIEDELFDPLAPSVPFVTDVETDRHGNVLVPPNFFQLKHAEREKMNTFARLWREIQLANIDWDEFIEWIDTNPPSDGDRLRQHRLRNAKINKAKDNLATGRLKAAEKRNGKKGT